jgi:hypothetical protein
MPRESGFILAAAADNFFIPTPRLPLTCRIMILFLSMPERTIYLPLKTSGPVQAKKYTFSITDWCVSTMILPVGI